MNEWFWGAAVIGAWFLGAVQFALVFGAVVRERDRRG